MIHAMRWLVLPVIILVIFLNGGHKHVNQHKNYVNPSFKSSVLLKNYTIKEIERRGIEGSWLHDVLFMILIVPSFRHTNILNFKIALLSNQPANIHLIAPSNWIPQKPSIIPQCLRQAKEWYFLRTERTSPEVTKTRIHLVNTWTFISILRELIQKQNGKRHRQHSSAYIPTQLISAAKRRQPALQIFQNRCEKLLAATDETHKHPTGNALSQGRTL